MSVFPTAEQNKIATQKLEREVADELRRYFERDVAKQKQAADALGISHSLMSKFIAGSVDMVPITFGKLRRLYKEGLIDSFFYTQLLIEDGLVVYDAREEIGVLDAAGINSEVSGETVQRASDGIFCHQDKGHLIPRITRAVHGWVSVIKSFKATRHSSTRVISPFRQAE